MSEQRHIEDPPAFDFYPERWLAGVAHLSDLDQIRYLRLLCHQWLQDGLPDDRKALDRLAGGRVSEAVLTKFPPAVDGLRRNKRLEVVRERLRARRKARRDGAAETNRIRWGSSRSEDSVTRSSVAERVTERHLSESPPYTIHHTPEGYVSSAREDLDGADDSRACDLIAGAYVRQDDPVAVREHVLAALRSGVRAVEILAAVRMVAAGLRKAGVAPSNRYVPPARNFFLRQEWREPAAFVARFESAEGGKKNKEAAPTVEAMRRGKVDVPVGWEAVMDEVFGDGWRGTYAGFADLPPGDQAMVRRKCAGEGKGVAA